MSTDYILSLPKAAIAIRNKIYVGAAPEAVWIPCNPDTEGWKKGDTLTVACHINTDPGLGANNPGPDEYAGLVVGACYAKDETAISALENQAHRLLLPNVGQLLNLSPATIIKTELPEENSDIIFYDATSTAKNFKLSHDKGTLNGYIYKWTMKYNHNYKHNNEVEIVFGYGDPHCGEVGMPVKNDT